MEVNENIKEMSDSLSLDDANRKKCYGMNVMKTF